MTSPIFRLLGSRGRLRGHHGLLIVALGCLLLSGCGRQEYELVPVSGRVTLDGRAIADITVSFQPVARQQDKPNPGPGSYGITDAEGHFSLRTLEPDADGAVVGTHKVYLRTKRPPQDPADDRGPVGFKEIIPPQWHDGSRTFEVPPEGTDKADFAVRTR